MAASSPRGILPIPPRSSAIVTGWGVSTEQRERWARKQAEYDVWQRRVYNNTASIAGAHERREVEELVRRCIPASEISGPVLEVGCGSGRLAGLFAGARYVGIDALPARPVRGVTFLQALGEELPFRSHSFAEVLLIGVLDHVLDVDAVLAEAVRVSRRGGTVYITSKVRLPGLAFRHLGRAAVRAVGKAWRGDISVIPRAWTFLVSSEDMFHMRSFTKSSLLQLCERRFGRVTWEECGDVLAIRGGT